MGVWKFGQSPFPSEHENMILYLLFLLENFFFLNELLGQKISHEIKPPPIHLPIHRNLMKLRIWANFMANLGHFWERAKTSKKSKMTHFGIKFCQLTIFCKRLPSSLRRVFEAIFKLTSKTDEFLRNFANEESFTNIIRNLRKCLLGRAGQGVLV